MASERRTGEPFGEQPGMLAQLWYGGRFPVSGAEPRADVIETFDDAAVGADDFPVRRDLDTEIERIGRDEAAGEQ